MFSCLDSTPTGILGGPCKTGGTCNAGLVCEVRSGSAICVDPDASTDDASVDAGADVEAGPRTCTFKPTVYPCGGQNPPFACYGPTQSCSLTGCSGLTDIQWQCFSPNQCNSPCCLGGASDSGPIDAVLTGTPDCSQGTIQMLAVDGGGGVNGAICSQGAQCPADAIQLCQANSQCPTGKVCSPVKVTNGGLSMNGAIIGACVPE
jgi:hypothetical protein